LGITSSSSTEDESLGLGINVSPEALFEAQKSMQSRSFISSGKKQGPPIQSHFVAGLQQSSSKQRLSNAAADVEGIIGYNSRHEIYDCIAPPGPLGIIVDSTSAGPMVHSMKPSSQLIDLIRPGDLIVGLDDIDTRGMTAPTLTRLMAKKSQQPQRKITLLRKR